ncbi:hypothetical protein [Niallia sp. FSL W8-0951]
MSNSNFSHLQITDSHLTGMMIDNIPVKNYWKFIIKIKIRNRENG